MNLLADIHHGAYRQAPKHAAAEPVRVEEAPLVTLLDEAELLECVVRLLVAGLGAGREGVEASRCRLVHGPRWSIVVRPAGHGRPVPSPARRRAAQLSASTLLTGADRRSAIEWLKARGQAVTASRSMSARWLHRVIGEAVPAVPTIRGHALSRNELDRVTRLVGHGTGVIAPKRASSLDDGSSDRNDQPFLPGHHTGNRVSRIYALIDGAKWPIDMVMYEPADTTALRAFATVASRGLRVRVPPDRHCRGGSVNKAVRSYLGSHKVAVRWGSSPTIVHEKAMVVGDEVAAIGTGASEPEQLSDHAIFDALTCDTRPGADCHVLMEKQATQDSAFATPKRAGCAVRTRTTGVSAPEIHTKAVVASVATTFARDFQGGFTWR